MGWSFRIARIAGIDIKVHITFFVILILAAVQWGGITGGADGALFGVVLMILLFACVTLHELGHSLAARYFGVPVREITLLPLGGVAIMTKNPEKPLHELIIAAAGPLVNVIIAGLLFIPVGAQVRMNLLDGRGLLPDLTTVTLSTLLVWLFAANVSMIVFNLIPAFPLDGGRILRSLLAMVLGFTRATRIASTIGQIIAVGLGVYGVVSGNFLLVLTAVFIFFGASQENSAAQSKTVLVTQKIGDTYNKHALTLHIGDRISRAVDFILTSYQPDFAIMQGSKLLGVLTREDVLRTLATTPGDPYVTEVMQREIARLDADDALDVARDKLKADGARIGAVYRGSEYLGLVNLDDIGEAFAVLSFVQLNRQKAVGAVSGGSGGR